MSTTPPSSAIPTPDEVHTMLAFLLANGRRIDPQLQDHCRRISKAYRSLEADHKAMHDFLIKENTVDFEDDLTQHNERTNIIHSLQIQ